MEFRELRHYAGKSQQEFADFFGIPVGTLRNWEQGISSPPSYVYRMIFQGIRRDKMINVETIKFMNLLNELSDLTLNGIENFSNATSDTFGTKIFYDSKDQFKVVSDACIIDHHDIIGYYESELNEYIVRVEFDEENDKPFVVVKFTISNEEIVIEDGKWYFL